MKKIGLIILLFTGILTSCSENENPTMKTNLELLTEKKWIYSNFEFISSSFNDNNYSSSEIEMKVDEIYENVSMKFESNGDGKIESSNGEINFTWELNERNLEVSVLSQNGSISDTFPYLINFENSKLELKMIDEITLNINGNELNAKGIQYYR